MRVQKIKTRKGKKFLGDREPKTVENDKSAVVVRGGKTSPAVQQALNELYLLKKPLATKMQRKNPIHPFEDDSLLCKFSQRLDSSLFVFGFNSKKRPDTLIFGRMYDHHLLDMVELRMDKFVSSKEFKTDGVTLGVKPCILLQGPLFETDETLQRVGNLMVDWFRGTKVESMRLQGLEMVLAITAFSPELILFRVYRTVLKKAQDSTSPRVELVEMGPSIDFRLTRHKLASESLFKSALKKPKPISQKPSNKNVRYDTFGNKMAKVHTGRQPISQIQTRKVKALKRRAEGRGEEEAMEE